MLILTRCRQRPDRPPWSATTADDGWGGDFKTDADKIHEVKELYTLRDHVESSKSVKNVGGLLSPAGTPSGTGSIVGAVSGLIPASVA